MRRICYVATAIIGAVIGVDADADDWPQYRFDASRTAASSQELSDQLHLQWVRDLGTPDPAFPRNVRLEFDRSYEPVVLGRLMFVPSMVTESVTALDTATGEERWCFFAEGPVRFAPVAWEGRVYFVSDDGFLYCLEATDGKLLWKFRGLPADRNDRTLLGSGRLTSLRPARGGPVLREGVVYFAAGIWPAEGVFVHALDAQSGDVVWSNLDSSHIARANQDHGIAQYAGLAPQGYLTIVDDKLVVPCGAQLPALLDLATGELASYHMGWGGRDGLPKGSWFVAGCGKYLCQSGDIYDLRRPNDEKFRDARRRPDFKSELYTGGFTRIRIDPTNHKDLGTFRQPVFTPDVLYETNGGITACDLTSVPLIPREQATIPANRQDDTFPDKFSGKLDRLWRLPSKLDVHIKAGQKLFCAGPGALMSVRVPVNGGQPRVVWRATIDGTPHRLLAADGRLFVVSREGRLFAFGAEKTKKIVKHPLPASMVQEKDAWSDKVARVLAATNATAGYAVVLGLESGRLVEELVRQSELYVIAVDPDAAKVAAIRRRFQQLGIYGSRACIRVGKPLSYPLPPYVASLIVSEHSADLAPNAMGAVLRAIYPKLRPYGGTAALAIGGGGLLTSRPVSRGGPLNGLQVRDVGDWTLISRTGALAGAADWSHELANSANTGASTDKFVQAPLGLLWFDASTEWHRKPGSALVRVAGGRVLVKAQTLHAIDVFTGRLLWEATLPFSHTATDQMVTAPDAIYVTGGETCVVLDPETGREMRRIELPAELSGPWRNVRTWEDYLVATSGRSLLCLHRQTGEILWRHECNRAALSVAVGGGRVYCAELPDRRRGENERTAVTSRAFDIGSGEIVWNAPRGSALLYCESLDLLASAKGIFRGDSGELLHKLPDTKKRKPVPGPLFVIGDRLLWGTVESFAVINLKTGAREGEHTAWVRRGCTTIRASEHMVTTRVRANAAYIDLESREATSLWNIRPACLNNLYPANGVLNAPNVLGGCTCNYTHASQAYVPVGEIDRASFGKANGTR